MRSTDSPQLFAYRSLPEVYNFQTWAPETPGEAEQFVENYTLTLPLITGRWQQLGIFLRSHGNLIGDCGFCLTAENQAKIGYTIAPDFQRQGIATEVVNGLVQYLFQETTIHKIIALSDPENIGSIRVLQRTGFKQTDLLHNSIMIRGEWKDDAVYTISRSF